MDDETVWFCIGAFVMGILMIVIILVIDPKMLGVKAHYNGEIKCETLENKQVTCYEVK